MCLKSEFWISSNVLPLPPCSSVSKQTQSVCLRCSSWLKSFSSVECWMITFSRCVIPASTVRQQCVQAKPLCAFSHDVLAVGKAASENPEKFLISFQQLTCYHVFLEPGSGTHHIGLITLITLYTCSSILPWPMLYIILGSPLELGSPCSVFIQGIHIQIWNRTATRTYSC